MRRSVLPALALFFCALAMSGQSLAPVVGPAIVAVVPVVISAPGADGASYHTAVQAYNPSAVPMTGVFLFRDQATGATVETTVPYQIDPGQTLSFPDLLATMGRSGIGSLDVVGATGTDSPVLSVRVYNDAGAAGTTGFTEDTLAPSEALTAGQSTALVAPFDSVAFRFNVGIRTFDTGATIRATLRDHSGNVRTTLMRTFPANAFVQADAASFLGGFAPGPSDTITIDVTAGSLMVYGATADNTTGDPAISVARKIS